MAIIIGPLLFIVSMILGLFKWTLILSVILSWLLAFNVVNAHSPFVNMLADVFFRITEPFLGPIRRSLPYMGGMDFAPFVLILIVIFLEMVIGQIIIRYALL